MILIDLKIDTFRIINSLYNSEIYSIIFFQNKKQ